MIKFSVMTAGDRPTPRQRLEQIIQQDRDQHEPTRLRIPVHIYDRSTRDYKAVPDLAWNVTFPETEGPEEIEAVLEALGKCLVLVGELGAELVLRVLTDPTDPT